MSTIEAGSGNVYADIGLPDAEAMQAKARVVASIYQSIGTKGISLAYAARLTGTPVDELNKLLVGQFQAHSLRELEHMQQIIMGCTKV